MTGDVVIVPENYNIVSNYGDSNTGTIGSGCRSASSPTRSSTTTLLSWCSSS